MFIDIAYLLNTGLPISEEISNEKLNRAIFTAENYIIKPRLGEFYNLITENPTEYSVELSGGVLTDDDDKRVYVAGLQLAEAHLAYAYLLTDFVNVTTFGAVLKNDDYSSHADADRLRNAGMMHVEIGLQYLREITDFYHIKNDRKQLPDFWEELI